MHRSVVRLFAIAGVVVIAAAGALVAATSGNSALSGAALPASVGLSGWDTTSNSWTHGNTVPLRGEAGNPLPARPRRADHGHLVSREHLS